ncbi:efflux RND transporter periplasmic adaptor subunit [Curvibacter sp. APW13]|uniref:efflux RND transporter periplasmic adaptor subunit n=1 Tax=Curvibacter sp. APW13 TaxID=3077236 RepID=UPI0028DEA1DC|nr:efflux RND transporter periplasmic adaptor subunit [Curvibacter sp. APW13]MDT8990947.1 efflux RND transporter periplasmic adaptor subunit [Curvibacter sp. APW13]
MSLTIVGFSSAPLPHPPPHLPPIPLDRSMHAPIHFRPLALLALAALLSACQPASNSASPAAAASAPTASAPANGASAPATGAPVSVTLVQPQKRDMGLDLRTTGTVVAVTAVDVRAQASNPVVAVHVKEGQWVKAGERLVTLDTRNDEANVARLTAQKAKDQAALADAQRQLARAKDLVAQKFMSQSAVDTAQAQVDAQSANVAADQAAIDQARVTLSYGTVKAPISGRVGLVGVNPGSALIANQTAITTITQLDPIQVQFTLPQDQLADALRAVASGKGTVTATLPATGATVQGKLQFVDSQVDAASGTIKAKANFANKDQALWPGAYVQVALTLKQLNDALVIPQAAIVTSQRGTAVFVLEDGKAVAKPIKTVYAANGEAAVTGLKGDERIVLDGRQNVRPGAALVERKPQDKGADKAGSKDGAAKSADAPRPAASAQ